MKHRSLLYIKLDTAHQDKLSFVDDYLFEFGKRNDGAADDKVGAGPEVQPQTTIGN